MPPEFKALPAALLYLLAAAIVLIAGALLIDYLMPAIEVVPDVEEFIGMMV